MTLIVFQFCNMLQASSLSYLNILKISGNHSAKTYCENVTERKEFKQNLTQA